MKKLLLHYKIYSQNKEQWVVLVHGAGGSSTIWYRQIRAYRKHFNVLIVDLRGHGNCTISNSPNQYTLDLVSKDIIEVLDEVGIEKAHFVGISLGTILIRHIVETHPTSFLSMILAGAVIRFTPRLKFLIGFANTFKKMVPFIWLYKMFAWILMPRKTHEDSRNMFVQEAKKIKQREFLRWLSMTGSMAQILIKFNEKELNIPCLYIMGEEDFVFLEPVRRIVKQQKASDLMILPNSGHVVNVDQYEQFNNISIDFLQQNKKETIMGSC